MFLHLGRVSRRNKPLGVRASFPHPGSPGQDPEDGEVTLQGVLGQLLCSAASSTLYLETVRHWLLFRPGGDTDEWVACALQKKNTRNASEPLYTGCPNSAGGLASHQAPEERATPLPGFLTGTHLSLG